MGFDERELRAGHPSPSRAVATSPDGRSIGPARRRLRQALRPVLGDGAAYDPRRNPAVLLAILFALPIPLLSMLSSAPAWLDVVSTAVAVGWAMFVAAAARVARVQRERLRELRSSSEEARLEDAEGRAALLDEARSERSERERVVALQRVMDAELVLAADVHRSLLPEPIVHPEVEVVVHQVPCSHVGGDYLHAALPRPDLLYLCVGDVAGHGVSAALVVSRIHGLVERMILEERDPEYVVEALGRAARRILVHTSLFITFGVFRVDLAAGRIDYATAGHPAQLLLGADGRVRPLVTANGLLGSLAPVSSGSSRGGSIEYRPGDTLMLFTDGLFEVLGGARGDLLGESGLVSILAALPDSPPQELAAGILRKVAEYGRTGPFDDDVSLLLARLGTPSRGVRRRGGTTPAAVSAERDSPHAIPRHVVAARGLEPVTYGA